MATDKIGEILADLDGAVIRAPNGTDYGILRNNGAGSYLVVTTGTHQRTLGRVEDLLAMGLAGPDERRYRVSDHLGDADLATLDKVASRFMSPGATIILLEDLEGM